MLKSNTTTDKYKLNEHTVLTVKNVPETDDDGHKTYKVELTLKHKLIAGAPLTFAGHEQIAEFIGDIDFEDEQTELPI